MYYDYMSKWEDLRRRGVRMRLLPKLVSLQLNFLGSASMSHVSNAIIEDTTPGVVKGKEEVGMLEEQGGITNTWGVV